MTPIRRCVPHDCAHKGRPEGRAEAACLDRQVARGRPRPRRARAVEPDDRRGHRGDRRTHDPCWRPLARRLRLVQLPRLRPRPGDHRCDPRVRGEVGNASELVTPARQSGPLQRDRRAADCAARRRGQAHAADDHLDPHVGDPGAGGFRDDLRRVARAQDDLRGLPAGRRPRRDGQAVRVRGRRRPRALAERRGRDAAADLRRRRQQHDRQRDRLAAVRPTGACIRRPAVRRRRARVRRHRRAQRRRAVAVRQSRKQHHQARRRDLRPRRPRRRPVQGVLVARRLPHLPTRAEAPAEDGSPAISVFGPFAHRLARDRARRSRAERAAGRRHPRHAVAQDRSRPGTPRPAGRPHAQPVGVPDHRGAARARQRHRRRRQVPVRQRHLRHARRLPTRPAERSRFPHSADCGQHGRRDRPTARRARPPRQSFRPAAGAKERARGMTFPKVSMKGRDRVWFWYLAVATGLTALYLFVPPLAGNGPLINALGLSGVVAIVVGIRRNKPTARAAWWLFAAGQFLYFSGDVYTYGYRKVFGADVPFPSIGDAFYLTVYPVLFAGLFVLVKRRNPRRDRTALIDALILTIGIGLLSWVFLIAPNIHVTNQTWLQTSVGVAYPLGDVILLAGLIRLAVDAGRRTPAFWLLVGSIVSLLTTDSAYNLALLKGTFNYQLSYDAGWIFYYLLWGAAALHPSMRTLEEPARDPRTRL